MKNSLDKVTIKGFKSIQSLENFELSNLNILIGGNGAGKSNFIEFFRLLRAVINNSLNGFIREGGGIGDFLHNGRKVTTEMVFELHFGQSGYRFRIIPGPKEACTIADEAVCDRCDTNDWETIGDSADGTSLLVSTAGSDSPVGTTCKAIADAVAAIQTYHFHDSGSTAGMRHAEIVENNKKLLSDGSNIAPFLLGVRNKHPRIYAEILSALRLVLPFFEGFYLDIEEYGNKRKVDLAWKQKGSEYPMQPYHFSDGAIRFICLAAALIQPDPPSVMILDEPELGLHPTGIGILTELIECASRQTRLIIATQSPLLISDFSLEDIIVVKRKHGATVFDRMQLKDFNYWLEEYTIGELWTKNVIAGGPVYE